MSIEFEVKFNIDSKEKKNKIISDKNINKFGYFYDIKMFSYYYDTKDLDLKNNNFALRIRKEKDIYIATLKQRVFKNKKGIFERNEWNIVLKDNHFNIYFFEEKAEFLKKIINNKKLKIIFKVKFIRKKMDIFFLNSKLEFALDYGFVFYKKNKIIINECEIELKNGEKKDIFKFIKIYLSKFNLFFEEKSKFEKGIFLYLKNLKNKKK